MKVVGTYGKQEEAHLAASILEGSGIQGHVRDSNMATVNWLYTNALGGVRLEVYDEDYERALEVLGTPVSPGILLVCPKCGSSNTKMRELSLLTSLCIGVFGFLLPVPSVKVDCYECRNSWKIDRTGKNTQPVAGGDATRWRS